MFNYSTIYDEIKQIVDSKMMMFILWIIFIITFEMTFRDLLFNFSLTIEPEFQKSGNFILFLMKIFSILGTEIAFSVILLFIINFDDTFKSYIIYMLCVSSNTLTITLKMVYREARPYYINKDILPLNCEGGYGNPSGHSLASAAIYLSIWKLYYSDRENKDKFTSLVLFLCLIFFIMLSRLYMGVHSLNQIVFGFLIGFSIFIFLFYVIELDYSKFQTFLFKVSIFNYILVNITIFLLIILIYLTTYERNQLWIDIIKVNCKSLPKIKMLHEEALFMIPVFLSNISAFVSIKFDIFNHYQNDMVKWCNENLSHISRKYHSNIYSLNFFLSHYDKNNQWNNTDKKTSFIRLGLLIMCFGICLIPFFLINFDSNLFIVMLFKLLLPLTFALFFCFYLFKSLCEIFNLINYNIDNNIEIQ